MGRPAGRLFKEFCQPGQEVNDLFTVMTEDSALRLQAAPSCHLPYTRASQNPLFLRDTPSDRRKACGRSADHTGNRMTTTMSAKTSLPSTSVSMR